MTSHTFKPYATRTFVASSVALAAVLLAPSAALAHVVVTPKQAGIGEYVTFNVSVPNEKSTDVTMLKLAIPGGVKDVTPTVTPDWTVTTDGGDSVTAITWTGVMPAERRTDFTFSAQVPASATTLDWKAYQTYGDGSTVHWDQTPSATESESADAGPYSITKVVNDVSTPDDSQTQPASQLPLVLSIIAVVFSAVSLLVRRRK